MERMHTEVVVAQFDQPADAREAMIDLEVKGIDADAIHLASRAPSVPTKEATRGVDLDIAAGLAGRSIKGGLLGALVGASLMIATLTIARVEPLGSTLLIGALAGAVGGLFIGAYWGAVVRLPVNEDAFDTYEVDPADSSRVVLQVRVDDPRAAADAVAVLRRHHAQRIDREGRVIVARAIWSGSLSLGLVNVPVKLHSAVKRKDVHFHQLQESTGARIRYKKVSEKSGREVDSDSIVKGYELAKGNYVTVTDEDFEAAEPERTHTIEVEDFVDLNEVDPLQFVNTYWIAPKDSKGASKAYALLRDAMDKKGRVAVARFVLRTKEHLVLVRPVKGALALHTMLFPDEIIEANEVDGLPVRVKAVPREVKMAEQLIDSLTVKWDPKKYRDTYREKLLDVIKRKAKGEEIVTEPKEERADVVDLMAALEASIEASKSRRTKSRTKKSA